MIILDTNVLSELMRPAPTTAVVQWVARGIIPTDRPHPRSPHRPESDAALLRDIGDRLDAAIAQVKP